MDGHSLPLCWSISKPHTFDPCPTRFYFSIVFASCSVLAHQYSVQRCVMECGEKIQHAYNLTCIDLHYSSSTSARFCMDSPSTGVRHAPIRVDLIVSELHGDSGICPVIIKEIVERLTRGAFSGLGASPDFGVTIELWSFERLEQQHLRHRARVKRKVE